MPLCLIEFLLQQHATRFFLKTGYQSAYTIGSASEFIIHPRRESPKTLVNLRPWLVSENIWHQGISAIGLGVKRVHLVPSSER